MKAVRRAECLALLIVPNSSGRSAQRLGVTGANRRERGRGENEVGISVERCTHWTTKNFQWRSLRMRGLGAAGAQYTPAPGAREKKQEPSIVSHTSAPNNESYSE